MAKVRVVQPGAPKDPGKWPYTICIVANPWIEAPESSGTFVSDPIMVDEALFEQRAGDLLDSIFGRLPGQAETMFAPLAGDFRVISIFDAGLDRKDANALVAHDNTNIVLARQMKFVPFLKRYDLPGMGPAQADVAFAITASPTHDRSTAWFTLDNDGADGRPFLLDDREMFHRQHNMLPGAVALHVSATSIVGLHEFSHAASSWTNGMVGDLYVDAGDGLNKRRGRPIAAQFCVYDGTAYASSTDRGGDLDYPADWTSYHPALADPAYPAVMDDFWKATEGKSELCRHDHLTRQFLVDRITAIMSR